MARKSAEKANSDPEKSGTTTHAGNKKVVENVPSGEDLGTEQGYLGQKVDPRPDSDYSLESGPDSPSAREQNATALEQRAEALKG